MGEARVEELHKEIDLIQNVITRMASNSFFIKGWAISIVTAVFIFGKDDKLILVALFPTMLFWYLDAFFLRQERLFRKLYQWVIENRSQTDKLLYSLDTERFSKEVDSQIGVAMSNTLLTFYGCISGLILLLRYAM